MTIRVLIADDQSLIRGGFRVLIDSAPDLEVVGEASDGVEAVTLTRALRPDVVVMDIRMPGRDGLSATQEICADDALTASRVLILTTFEVDEYVFEALRAGASGFIGKGIEPVQLLDAIRVIHRGESLLSPRATRRLITAYLAQPRSDAIALHARLLVLTDREREMVAAVATGLSNEEIAGELVLSPLTVKTHINRAMVKLRARDRAQLVVMAYQTGLVQAPPLPPGSVPPGSDSG